MTVMLQCLLSCMAMVHLAVVLLLKLFCHSTYSCPLSIPRAANFAHTDVRWPNVINCSNDTFCLIELETAVGMQVEFETAWPAPRGMGKQNLGQRQVHSKLRLGPGGAVADRAWLAGDWGIWQSLC